MKNIVDSRNLMLEARMIKNQDEIDCLKTCASMVDGVWYRVWENLKPGIRDTDLMRSLPAPAGRWDWKGPCPAAGAPGRRRLTVAATPPAG